MRAIRSLQRVTVTVPKDLLAFADRQAQELNVSRSQIISMALARTKASEEERVAAEGYRFYAEEAASFAAAASQAVAEAWDASWDEQPKEDMRHGRTSG